MARIRVSMTAPERRVRSVLHQRGFRFARSSRELPGKPDVVLPRYKTVIFVHGCFWHCHSRCGKGKMPATRTAWWTAKLNANVKRDASIRRRLSKMGWTVVTIWECQTKRRLNLAHALQPVLERQA